MYLSILLALSAMVPIFENIHCQHLMVVRNIHCRGTLSLDRYKLCMTKYNIASISQLQSCEKSLNDPSVMNQTSAKVLSERETQMAVSVILGNEKFPLRVDDEVCSVELVKRDHKVTLILFAAVVLLPLTLNLIFMASPLLLNIAANCGVVWALDILYHFIKKVSA